jgi:ketosteroid isomerase-like protein
MTAQLPHPLADYFAATNAHDLPAMCAAFTEDAVVKDEGREHHGLSAIRGWMKETIEKYDYQVEPIESSRMGARTAVLVSIRGKFPGSPITLQYEVTLEGQKIARLEIG